MSYILGKERLLEWAHSVGVTSDAELGSCVSHVPPSELRGITAAPEEEVFLWTGIADFLNIFSIYERLGSKPANAKPRVLDFGCGCGRLTRLLNMKGDIEAFGVDINPDLVDWCRINLDKVETRLNGQRPPTPFEDKYFHFVYSLSIFSHLNEDIAQQWLDDIARVMAPGALLVLTTHGYPALNIIRESPVHHAMFHLDRNGTAALIDKLAVDHFVHMRCDPHTLEVARAGSDYGHTFIDPEYIAAKWNNTEFTLVEHIPGGLRGWQDIVILRRTDEQYRASQSTASLNASAIENQVNEEKSRPPAPEPSVQMLCATYGEQYRVVNEIHPQDLLFKFLQDISPNNEVAVQAYFSDGLRCAEMLKHIVESYLGPSRLDCKILEFANGYGRVTRHLGNVLPKAKVTCCDIHEEANIFTSHKLGCATVTPTVVPEEFRTTERFDVTFVLSLFSHLPDHTWGRWLKSLIDTVAPLGILALTTHGRISAKNSGVEIPERGIWFGPASDQADLNSTEYGTSYVSARYAFSQINQLANAQIVDFVEGLWWGHQDLYVIRRLA